MSRKYEIRNDGRIVALRDFGDVKAGDVGGYVESEENLSHEGACWVGDDGRVFGNGWVYGNGQVCDDGQVYGNGQVGGRGRVYGNGRVYDNGRVYGNGRVHDNGRVYGHGRVYGYGGRVCDNGRVYGYGRVYDSGWVYGNGHVCDNGRVYDYSRVFDHGQVSGNGRVFGHGLVCGYGGVSGYGQVANPRDLLVLHPVGSENGTLSAYTTSTEGVIGCTRGCFTGTLDEFVAAVNKTHADNDAIRNEYLAAVELIRKRFGLKGETQ